MSPIVAQVIAENDRYRTLLRRALEAISADTVSTWLADLEAEMHNADDMGDRLEPRSEHPQRNVSEVRQRV